jgi:Protein of unknown function (DUF2934)
MATTFDVAPRAARKSQVTKKSPTPEQIQNRAYEIYLERRGAPGNPVQDWLRAEQELLAGLSAKPRKSSKNAK